MKNLIIDGGNLLHRSYHIAKKKNYNNEWDEDHSHVFVFLNNIKIFKEMFDCENVFLTWDIRDSSFKNFRHDAVGYKDQRNREVDDDVHKFDEILWDISKSLGVVNIRANKLEGDDIVYFLCNKYSDDENYVVSNDNDFLQLFNMFDGVKIYNPIKRDLITSDTSFKYNGGVSNDKYLLYKAIMGDKSDNINGLHKYGPVKSKRFVEKFEDNFKMLEESDQKIIKRNLKVMNLRYASKIYVDETNFFESQDIRYTPSINNFFEKLHIIGMERHFGYKMDWVEIFCKNSNDTSYGLQKMLSGINN